MLCYVWMSHNLSLCTTIILSIIIFLKTVKCLNSGETVENNEKIKLCVYVCVCLVCVFELGC